METRNTTTHIPQEGSHFQIQVHKDIPYLVTSEKGNSNRHLLNLAVPVDAVKGSPSGQVPVVMHVHGGGWKRGDRNKDFYGAPFMSQAIAEKLGCISIVISYRVGQRFPAHAEDVASAISWAYRNVSTYGGDVSRFFISGHSAGGHLVSLVALDSQFLDRAQVPLHFVKGVISISGIYTLAHPMDGGFNGWANWAYRKVYIHGTFGDVVRDWEMASPITHVRRIAAEKASDSNTPSGPIEQAEAPSSPSWDKKEEYLEKFGDPLLSPPRLDAQDNEVQAQAENEQAEMVQTNTPPVVLVSSTELNPLEKSSKVNIELVGSKDHYVPPFLVINAESDLGLEFDGNIFFKALKESGLVAEYQVIPATNHASVTKSYVTINRMRSFMNTVLAGLTSSSSGSS